MIKNKEILFLVKFRGRFTNNKQFRTAIRDMRDEGLIKEASYQAMVKKYPVKKARTKTVKKENRPVSNSFLDCDSQDRLAKHLYRESKKRKKKTPTIGSSCEDAQDPCAPTRGGGISCTPIARRC